jgi:hypothetical protein
MEHHQNILLNKFGNMEKISYITNKKNMFTLYHIPKRKEWGCTKNLTKRLKTLSYNIEDISDIILESDINKAADLEKKLNIEYGYGWNSSRDYRLQVKRAYKSNEKQSLKKLKSSSNQGKIIGKTNIETGHLKSICVLGGKVTANKPEWKVSSAKGGFNQSQIIRECNICGKVGKGNAMLRHHFENCKDKKIEL